MTAIIVLAMFVGFGLHRIWMILTDRIYTRFPGVIVIVRGGLDDEGPEAIRKAAEAHRVAA